MKAYNEQVIREFCANKGEVGGPLEGTPLLLLTTTGAKSGRRHTTPLGYASDGERLIVFASVLGAPNNPAWYLVAHPEVGVETGEEAFDAVAVVAEGAERDRLWELALNSYPTSNVSLTPMFSLSTPKRSGAAVAPEKKPTCKAPRERTGLPGNSRTAEAINTPFHPHSPATSTTAPTRKVAGVPIDKPTAITARPPLPESIMPTTAGRFARGRRSAIAPAPTRTIAARAPAHRANRPAVAAGKPLLVAMGTKKAAVAVTPTVPRAPPTDQSSSTRPPAAFEGVAKDAFSPPVAGGSEIPESFRLRLRSRANAEASAERATRAPPTERAARQP
jgi:deazaflavin-dependent oxidoreductase (nitroreductase family)